MGNNLSKYDKFYVMVCNTYDESRLNSLERQILNGLKAHWIEKGNHGYNLHFIYLSPDDEVGDDKFDCLQYCTTKSKIIFVGHTWPGWDGIESTEKYYMDDGKEGIHVFTYDWLIDILIKSFCCYGNAQKLLIEPHSVKSAHFRMDCFSDSLKIGLTSCFSGLPVNTMLGSKSMPSFGEKFYEYAINNPTAPLCCYVIAYKGLVLPFPVKNADLSTRGLLSKMYSEIRANVDKSYKRPYEDKIGGGFTKGIIRLPFGSGSFDWASLNPFRTKTDDKVIFGIDRYNSSDKPIIKEYTYEEYKKYRYRAGTPVSDDEND